MKTKNHSNTSVKVIAFLTALLIFSTIFLRCSRSTEASKDVARKAMLFLMQELKTASEELSAEKIFALHIRDPEFIIIWDGKGYSHEEFIKTEREHLPTYKHHKFTWDSILVKVLSMDVVAASAQFHEIITDKNNIEKRLKGDGTWIAVRREGEWKFLYTQILHQPDTI